MSKGISVIIPIYNSQEYICETLSSVERQNLQPLEVLIIDDKSTDNSVEEIKKFSKESKLNIIMHVNQRKKGLSGALNYGIENAMGDFIAMLDSDDLWTPVHLQQLFASILKYPNINIAFSEIEVFGDGEDVDEIVNAFKYSVPECLEKAFEQKQNNIWISNKKLLSTLFQFGFPFRCQASLINKEFLFKNNLLFDEDITYTLDSQFMTMAAYNTPFIFVKNVGLKYRRHSGNDLNRNYGEKIYKSFEVRILKLVEYFNSKNLSREEKKALKNCLWKLQSFITEWKWRNKNFNEKIKGLIKFILLFPNLKSLKRIIKIIYSYGKN